MDSALFKVANLGWLQNFAIKSDEKYERQNNNNPIKTEKLKQEL